MLEGNPNNLSRENKEVEAKKVLDYYFRPRLNHDLSRKLPENKELDIKKFENVLIHWAPSLEYYYSVPKEGEDIKFSGISLNIGWKLHLNSSPENVNSIFNYLEKNKYLFKYLSGGEPGDGKIFTVYIGSHSLAKKISEKISIDLEKNLARPKDKTEIEFATGVVGRFVGPDKPRIDGSKEVEEPDFHQYGTCGFSLLKEDYGQILYSRNNEEHNKKIISNA